MGMNLNLGKQSFETLVCQMEVPTKMQFVIWLDEKLAEFKVQGFMNFNEESIPKWLKNYSKYMSKSGLSIIGEPLPSSPITKSSNTPAPSVPVSTNQVARKRQRPPETLPKEEQIEESHDTNKTSVQVKTEPNDEEEDDDVIMVLPEDVAESAENYQQSERLYRTNYTIQQRPMKSLRPAHRFAPKNSYAAAIAARKRRHNRPFPQRPAETIVHPSQQRQTSLHPSQNRDRQIAASQAIYAAGDYDESGYVETDPTTLANQASYVSEGEYIQFPIGSGDGQAHIKSEFYETEGDTSTSFMDPNVSDQQLSMLGMEGQGQEDLDQSYGDESYNEGAGMEPGTSGMQQESWASRQQQTFQSSQVINDANTCMVCGRRFRFYTDVKRHMRIHTGDRPYACQLCGQTFNRADALKNHKRRYHSQGH